MEDAEYFEGVRDTGRFWLTIAKGVHDGGLSIDEQFATVSVSEEFILCLYV